MGITNCDRAYKTFALVKMAWRQNIAMRRLRWANGLAEEVEDGAGLLLSDLEGFDARLCQYS